MCRVGTHSEKGAVCGSGRFFMVYAVDMVMRWLKFGLKGAC